MLVNVFLPWFDLFRVCSFRVLEAGQTTPFLEGWFGCHTWQIQVLHQQSPLRSWALLWLNNPIADSQILGHLSQGYFLGADTLSFQQRHFSLSSSIHLYSNFATPSFTAALHWALFLARFSKSDMSHLVSGLLSRSLYFWKLKGNCISGTSSKLILF